MKPNCLTPKSYHACAWKSVLQNKIETRLNRKRAIGIKLASRHIPSRPDKIGDNEKVADDLPLMSAMPGPNGGALFSFRSTREKQIGSCVNRRVDGSPGDR